MQENPTARSPDIQRLVDDGYTVSIDGQYLIVDNIPYVPSVGIVDRGAIISPYCEIGGIGNVNGDHTVWFTGAVPCTADGVSLSGAMVADTQQQIIAGRQVKCRLSNKPSPIGDMLDNFYNKMTHYIRKLTSYARTLDNSVSASGLGIFHFRQQPSVFLYANTAIARSGLDAYEEKLKVGKVSIVGTGGTGAYILDALAKTPVAQIHLFDDDVIEPHNAYRMPGALTIEQAHIGINKTAFLCQLYGSMRVGISDHPIRIDNSNVGILDDSDFVFVAIDDGPSRALIANHLVDKGIPFIDAGIGVDKVTKTTQLHSRIRVTLVTPETAYLVDTLPTTDDAEEAVYNNIQLSELNALNAMFAIIRYKQFLAFYTDESNVNVLKYKSSWSKTVLICRNENEDLNLAS